VSALAPRASTIGCRRTRATRDATTARRAVTRRASFLTA
jgi:hypothetical protein